MRSGGRPAPGGAGTTGASRPEPLPAAPAEGTTRERGRSDGRLVTGQPADAEAERQEQDAAEREERDVETGERQVAGGDLVRRRDGSRGVGVRRRGAAVVVVRRRGGAGAG